KEAAASTVAAVVEQFVAKYCERRQRPRTIKENRRMLERHVLPLWGKRSIASVSRADVRDMLDAIVDDTPVLANRLHEVVRRLFSWAVENDLITTSPVANLKKPAEKKSERDRVLDDNEIRLVMAAARTMEGPFGAAVRLLLLTGQRRGEVCEMPWSEIDLEKAVWHLPA